MPSQPTIVLHTDAPAAALTVLSQTHPDLAAHACDSYAALPALVAEAGAEVVYTVRFDGTPRFPRLALVESPTVKWVSVGGSGTDHLRPWDPRRVTVTNAAGVASDMVAEYVIGAMLSFSLGLRAFHRQQEPRQCRQANIEPIQGRSLLILGLGKTGQALAARAKAMGMTTIGVRARPRATPDVDEVHGADALPALWGRADYIACCLPLSDATRGLVGSDAFAAMKPSAVLVDVSRGGIVEERALVAALDSGRLRGAALDVFAAEPLPESHPLWGYDNVIVTPHNASIYDGWDVRCLQMFARNLDRYRRGEPLENVVDPVRGY